MNAHRRREREKGTIVISPLQKRTGFPRPNPNDNITLDWKTCPARTAHLAAEEQKGDGGGAAAQIAVHWERVQVSNVNCTLLRVKVHGFGEMGN